MTTAALHGEDYLAEIIGLRTHFDVFRFMKQLTETVRARAFMVLSMPPATSVDLQSSSILSNWPAELISLYDRERLIVKSPMVRRLRNSAVPFVHDMGDKAAEREDGRTGLAKSLFERFGMPRWGVFPTHDATGLRGVISFAGDREAFTPQEMKELSFVSIHVFSRLGELRQDDCRVGGGISERELDCLNWTAAGKTSLEIAEILGLSEHTINHYLNRAAKKLDTVNRTQAVAKALRMGLIR
ncbi:helix-turn-helix transcriptional regulator [Rhizobium sp. RAF56]|jgi:DNA-binding CsgD family transcriptional regulator|uniref:helix-turn-helix transcriptional regulator n=1 Tax=Rhizobium sp. RAF56 TaxID=3233062 RepID=UPI003F98C71A